MNEQNTTTLNPMQAMEALPLEENCLPAEEVIAEQQSSSQDANGTPPLFVP